MESLVRRNEILRSQKGPRWKILQALREHGPLTCEEIAQHTGLLSAVVGNNARAAKADMLVDRGGFDDVTGRPIYKITAAGRDWLKYGVVPEKKSVENTPDMPSEQDKDVDSGCHDKPEHEPDPSIEEPVTTDPEHEPEPEDQGDDLYAVVMLDDVSRVVSAALTKGRKNAIMEATSSSMETGKDITIYRTSKIGIVKMTPVFEDLK
jgi:DNA-binding HxlR family transcriptional regulator